MTEAKRPVFSAILAHETWVTGGALAALTALAWLYLLWVAPQMTVPLQSMPDMPGMVAAAAPQFVSWTAGRTAFVFVMWAVMMTGMMTPSVAPMVLIYAQVARQAETLGTAFASAGWFASGYLLAWTLFSVLATAAQYELERLALLSSMMAVASPRLSGAVLIGVGIYQFSPLKSVCLRQCRAPLSFIQRRGGFQPSRGGSLSLGFRHGLYCVGCCWALMALLFVVGVMNVLWIAALAAFVLAEKIVPGGRFVSAFAGLGAILFGVRMLLA